MNGLSGERAATCGIDTARRRGVAYAVNAARVGDEALRASEPRGDLARECGLEALQRLRRQLLGEELDQQGRASRSCRPAFALFGRQHREAQRLARLDVRLGDHARQRADAPDVRRRAR